jgi:hypothetical protein
VKHLQILDMQPFPEQKQSSVTVNYVGNTDLYPDTRICSLFFSERDAITSKKVFFSLSGAFSALILAVRCFVFRVQIEVKILKARKEKRSSQV